MERSSLKGRGGLSTSKGTFLSLAEFVRNRNDCDHNRTIHHYRRLVFQFLDMLCQYLFIPVISPINMD